MKEDHYSCGSTMRSFEKPGDSIRDVEIGLFKDYISIPSIKSPRLSMHSLIKTQDESLNEKLKAIELEIHRANDTIVAEQAEDSELKLDAPKLIWCPFCHCETVSMSQYEPTAKTFWASLGIFLSGGFLGCFMLPYIADNCKHAKIVCIRCKHALN